MQSCQRIFLALFGCLLISPITQGEYRAFLLVIKSPEDQEPRLVKSTLDPWQYRGYYPVREAASVYYTETWRCPGRTGGGLPICPSPSEKAAAQQDQSGPENPAPPK